MPLHWRVQRPLHMEGNLHQLFMNNSFSTGGRWSVGMELLAGFIYWLVNTCLLNNPLRNVIGPLPLSINNKKG